MIVCDYIDKKVKNYLNGNKSDITILTFFKEPFDNYKGNKIIFIDDILDEEDYREIDIFVNKVMKDAEEVFSKYLEVAGYKLFDYLKLQAKRNLSRVYRFKYGIDKVLKKEDKNIVYYFSCELELFKWIKGSYTVKKMYRNNLRIKTKIINLVKSSYFANFLFDKFFIKAFKDAQNKPKNILWMGGRSVNSQLINELRKKNRILLLPQYDGGKLGFAIRKYKFNLLKPKNDDTFNEKWGYLKIQYKKGLNKITLKIGLKTRLIEIIFNIDENTIKDLLLSLIVLEDNKDILNLLIVQQSVIGRQPLAVDFCGRNKFPSIEMVHGVPGVIEVGKTNKIAVYGKRDESFLSEHGVEKSKIVITGCSYYDRIFNIKEKEKSYDFLLLIPDSSPYLRKLLFKQIDDMLRLLKHFQSERLIVKLHPGQSEKELEYVYHLVKDIIRDKNKVKVVIEEDVINLLKNAKIVYVRSSSVGVEALLIKKPLIVLDYPGRKIDFEKYGGCLVAKNYEDLELSTEKILKDVHRYLEENNENIEKTRRYFSGDSKGESYKNVAMVINEMLYE